MAEAWSFARGAKQEQAMNSTGQNVLDDPLQTGEVERVTILKRRDERRDNSRKRMLHEGSSKAHGGGSKRVKHPG